MRWLDVIVDYIDRIGDNVLSPFVPQLERLCEAESDDTTGRPEDAYVAAWQEAATGTEWLDAFFDVRVEDLTNPANVETTVEWRESIDRVECMRRIADTGNYDLDGPITFTVYGDEFTIE